ncbi:FAD-dependent thymidylate synthase, partial [bacterium]|nr:FAD-dependent thymidylate synthase [bacterium]
PTLVKYADKVPYLVASCADAVFDDQKVELKPEKEIDWCNLVRFDKNAENFILAAASFRKGQQSFAKALEAIKTVSVNEKQRLAKKILGGMDEHDQPIREMEYANFTFDLTLDQGAYYELKRHRMMTQSPQPCTPWLGFATPRAMVDAGMEDEYRNAMEQAAFVYEELEKVLPHVGSYILPNGYNRRVLVEFNLRTAFHLLRLRTEPSAHFSMRRVAQRMAEEIRRVTPILGAYLKVNGEEDWHGIQEVFFHSVR